MKRFYLSKLIVLVALLAGFTFSANCQPFTTVSFVYTGAVQTYTVPIGVTVLTVDAVGNVGGNSSTGQRGGYGGRVQCALHVTGGEILYINVGGPGHVGVAGNSEPPGFNDSGAYGGWCTSISGYGGGGGGGGTDIRANASGIGNRVIVAGGGGGGGSNCTNPGGNGGGLIGQNASNCSSEYCGTGGTQTSGGLGGTYSGYGTSASGVLGWGGIAATTPYQSPGSAGGGGGGGYYGGGGGSWGGGGGGSSYTDVSTVQSISTPVHTQGYNTTGVAYVNITLPSCIPPTTGPISGTTSGCIGASSVFTTTSTAGGTWSSSNPAVATVGSTSGLVTSVSAGTALISYSLVLSCGNANPTPLMVTVNPPPAPIMGMGNICSATPVTLSSTTTGGIWSSSNTALATVGTSGIVTGIAQGFPVITYTAGGCGVTFQTTVNVSPNVYTVSGGGPYCAGSTAPHVLLSNADALVNYQLYLGATLVTTLPGAGHSLDFGPQATSGVYTVVAINTNGGCSLTMSGSATVTINPLPGANNLTDSGGITGFCVGGTGVTLGLNGSSTGVSYQLIQGTGAYGTAVTGTGSAFNFSASPVVSAGVYTIKATNLATGCSATMTGSQTITANPLPNVEAVSGGGSYCASGAGVPITVTPSDAGVNYQLYMGGSAYGATIPGTGGTVTFTGITPAGYYSVVATNASTGCSSTMSGIASVAIIPLPVAFTTSATNGGNYCAGGAGQHIRLSYSVLGISYQLYNSGGAVGLPIAGTNDSLDFGAQTIAGAYHIIGTNSVSGCTSTMAGSATITINSLPIAYTTSTVGATNAFCAGGAGVAVKLNSATVGIVYKLYENGVYAGTTDTAATSAAINFGLQTTGGYYTVVATNPATGCVNTMADTATVIENPLPTAYVVTGGGSYCAGGPGRHIYLSPSDMGISYQLYKGMMASGAPMTGTGSMLDFGADTATGSYTVVATNTVTGCVNNMSGVTSIAVNPLPQVFNITGGGTYCSGTGGAPVGLDFSASGIQYQLMLGGSAVGLPLSGIDSALSFGAQSTPGAYTISGTNAVTGCTSVMAGSETVSTLPSPIAYNVTGGGGYCSGGSGASVGLSASNNGISYQLYNGTVASGAPMAGTGYSLNFGNQLASGPYSIFTIVATNTATGCTATMTGSATVTLNAVPGLHAVTGGGAYCSGGSGSAVGLGVSDMGVNYQLYYNGSVSGAPVAGTGAALSFGTETLAGTYTVSAMNAATTCADSMPGSAIVSINSLPPANTVTGGGSYCTGSVGVPVALNGSNAGINYILNVGGTYAGTTLPGTGGSLSFGLQTMPGAYTVTAINTTTGCTATMLGSAAVNENALPTDYSVTGGGNYCSDSAAPHIGLDSSDGGVHYMLYNGTSLIGTYTTGTGAPVDFGTLGTPGVYKIVAVNPASGCSSTMSDSATVTRIAAVTPSVTVASGAGATICSGTPITFSATPVNGGTAPMYQWMVNGVAAGTDSSSYTYDPANGDVVTAMLTSSQACATGTATGAPLTLAVITSVTPSVTTASLQDSVCQGATEFFYAVPTNGGTSPTYSFVYNGVVVQTGPGLTYSALPASGDHVYVIMATSALCHTGSDSVTGNTITLYVQEPMIPVVSISANDSNVSSSASVTFTATATNTTTTAYQWYIDGSPVPGATNSTYTGSGFTDGDVVSCTVSNNDVCGTHSGSGYKTVHVIAEGVKQITLNGGDITVTPNPSQGDFIVKGTLASSNDVQLSLEVTNMLGQVVYNTMVTAANGKINEHIRLSSSVANGMYLLNLRSGGEIAVFHIVVEK